MAILKVYGRLLGWYCIFVMVLFTCGFLLEALDLETGPLVIILFINSLGIMAAITKVFVVAAIVITIAKHSGVWPQPQRTGN